MPKSNSAGLFALLDPARDAEIYPALERLAPDAECLLGLDVSPEIRRVSPHLAAMPEDGRLLSWWRQRGTGKAWGIACRTAATRSDLRRHFKKFLRIYLPSGEVVLFRFWDPRVLTAFLAGCVGQERSAFFGPVSEFYAEESETGEPVTLIAALSAPPGE